MGNYEEQTPEQPYSLAQMDNFYAAFAGGKIKPTSVMNYLQHLLIAQHCRTGQQVLDVCCGRGLQVPLLKHVVPDLGGYTGVDISPENLAEAGGVIRYGDGKDPAFPCTFIQGDVTSDLAGLHRRFDVVIYTSALEHMEKKLGWQSLLQVTQVLDARGTLFLSTPRTPHTTPPTLQHRVHVYEWDQPEIEEALAEIGLAVTKRHGLLLDDVPYAQIEEVVRARFGEGACAWFKAMQKSVPAPFLEPIVAAALPEIATEILYVCRWR